MSKPRATFINYLAFFRDYSKVHSPLVISGGGFLAAKLLCWVADLTLKAQLKQETATCGTDV